MCGCYARLPWLLCVVTMATRCVVTMVTMRGYHGYYAWLPRLLCYGCYVWLPWQLLTLLLSVTPLGASLMLGSGLRYTVALALVTPTLLLP